MAQPRRTAKFINERVAQFAELASLRRAHLVLDASGVGRSAADLFRYGGLRILPTEIITTSGLGWSRPQWKGLPCLQA